jgi:uncharacterized membrane protein HdeD (DUF308 family)
MVGWLYIAVGSVGFVFHFRDRDDWVWVELVELVAILAGVFVLRGHNWARWLAMAWIAFHVVLSAFHAVGEFAVHAVFCAVIAWVLFRPRSTPGDAAADLTTRAGR